MKPDMRPEAVTARLVRVNQFRQLCLSLARAGEAASVGGPRCAGRSSERAPTTSHGTGRDQPPR